MKNGHYSSEEGIPHCVLSWDSYSQYFTNDIYAKSFDNLKKELLLFNRVMNIKLDQKLGICNQNVSKSTWTYS